MKLVAMLSALVVLAAQPVAAQVLAGTVRCQAQPTPNVCTATITRSTTGDACQATVPATIELAPTTRRLRWVVEGRVGRLRLNRDTGDGVEFIKGADRFSPDTSEPTDEWRALRRVQDGKVKAEAKVRLVGGGSNCPDAGPVVVNRD